MIKITDNILNFSLYYFGRSVNSSAIIFLQRWWKNVIRRKS